MAFPDYPKTRNEKLWITPESPFNSLAYPAVTDAIIPLPGATLPPVLREFQPSLERYPSPGIRALIKRKKRPGAFTIPMYVKARAHATTPAAPSFGQFLKQGFGAEDTVLEGTIPAPGAPTDDLAGAGAGLLSNGAYTYKITFVTRNGETEGGTTSAGVTVTDFTTNGQVALTAIPTAGGGAAAHVIARRIYRTVAAGSQHKLVATINDNTTTTYQDNVADAALGVNVPTVDTTPAILYRELTNIEETSFSLWHFTDNQMRGFRGCLTNQVTLELSGSAEGRLTFAGFTGNEVFAGVTTIKAPGLADGVATSLPLTNARRFQVGPGASDKIRLQIEAETVELTAVTYNADGSGTGTIVRGVLGTTPVAHTAGTEVGPWVPGADTDPLDTIAPIILGDIQIGSVVLRGISATQVYNNSIEPRIDEYSEDTLTGYRRNGPRTVTGRVRAYSRQANQDFLTNLERELEETALITAGESTKGKLEVYMNRFRMENVTMDSGGPEFILEYEYRALEIAADGNDETWWAFKP